MAFDWFAPSLESVRIRGPAAAYEGFGFALSKTTLEPRSCAMDVDCAKAVVALPAALLSAMSTGAETFEGICIGIGNEHGS